MPKCCAIPECKKSEGKAEGYYKFPFQDKVRLRQWLANMNLENLVAIKNQHLCSQHFKPSCFQVKSGVRLLKPDAVPTIFPFTGGGSVKKHAAKVKIIHLTPTPKPDMEFVSLPLSGVDILPLSGVVETDTVAIAMDPGFSPGQVYIEADSMVNDIVMPSTVAGAVNLVPLVHFVESFDGLSLALTPQAQGLSSITLPFSLTGDHRSQDISLSQPVSFITEEQIASTSLQHDLYGSEDVLAPHEEVPTMIEVADDGTLLIKDVCIDPFSDCGLHAGAAEMSAAELVSYLETMQTATVVPSLSCPLPPLMPSSETVLSTSITAPISSTVPIVSKHATVVPEFFVEHEREESEGPSAEEPETNVQAGDFGGGGGTTQERKHNFRGEAELHGSGLRRVRHWISRNQHLHHSLPRRRADAAVRAAAGQRDTDAPVEKQ
uniref:THAP-type domain-containing protein n=1 Tax=Leptobrachium leishanense TaxID=445787 RepID=A0A8C5QYL3_9ANUR